jgi:hypothetical protein
MSWRTFFAIAVAAVLGTALLPATAAAGKQGTTWLCKPGLDDDPCRSGLRTTLISPAGEPLGTTAPKRSRVRKVDCFYVYPTVSDQPTQNANLDVDPELRSIALYQTARYSQHCRIYAPVYRQVTLAGLDTGGFNEQALNLAYGDVRRAWRAYKKQRARGRGTVLIGHSQGTFMLEKLLAEEIDPKRSGRRRPVAAILLGGGVTVKQGGDRGGSFDRVRACRSAQQLRCVIAFATFNDTVPPGSIFGRTQNEGEQVLCTNPAALGGGSGRLRGVYPSEPFAPETTIGVATTLLGSPVPEVDTPWYESRDAYTGRCSSADGASVLQIEQRPGAPKLTPIPTPEWGLHLADANIGLGNLTKLVGKKSRRYVKSRR